MRKVDKPEGVTSHDVVDSVRRIAGTRKVGHAGTLDPFATGVLIVGINQGTKLLPFLQIDEKEYEATVRLGVETDTLDRDGRILRETRCPAIGYEEMERTLASFVGRQSQIPPIYSAIKRDGVPLYKLARKGIEVDIPPREIEIYEIALRSLDLPDLSFTVRCSSGTYVRGLARDIGMKVGCGGGHLKLLRRTRSGRFGADKAVPLDRLNGMGSNWVERVIALKDALSFPEVMVDPLKAEMIRMGKELTAGDVGLGGPVPGKFMITCGKQLVAVAEEGAGKRLDLLRVFNP
ncbi:MAG: tRNA pseudouridine(55) synthase TruB [Deltaproteobacteria bacterium]|nr:tRNA pseudouridine(55) synthase TruB [Deltaproteobacteria bacterium]